MRNYRTTELFWEGLLIDFDYGAALIGEQVKTNSAEMQTQDALNSKERGVSHNFKPVSGSQVGMEAAMSDDQLQREDGNGGISNNVDESFSADSSYLSASATVSPPPKKTYKTKKGEEAKTVALYESCLLGFI